jgi:hypothetical protein
MLFVLLNDVVRADGGWIFAEDEKRALKEGGLALGKAGDADSERLLRGHGRRTADYLGSFGPSLVMHRRATPASPGWDASGVTVTLRVGGGLRVMLGPVERYRASPQVI